MPCTYTYLTSKPQNAQNTENKCLTFKFKNNCHWKLNGYCHWTHDSFYKLLIVAEYVYCTSNCIKERSGTFCPSCCFYSLAKTRKLISMSVFTVTSIQLSKPKHYKLITHTNLWTFWYVASLMLPDPVYTIYCIYCL